MGAGDSSRPDRPSPGLPLIKHKRECPVGTPSLLSVWCSRTSPPIAAGHPWALRRPGGRRSAHRRTIPRRRSAAPSGQGERPFVKCGFAAKPARRSPQAAANRQRLPLRVGAPAVAAPRGESGSKADEAARAAALRPKANRQRAAPAMLAAPAPQPTHNRRAAAGRAFPLGRSCGPAPMLAGHALAQRPRRCPRSMTPGTAAAPATGYRLRLLRPAADGGALRKLQRGGLRSGKAADESRSG